MNNSINSNWSVINKIVTACVTMALSACDANSPVVEVYDPYGVERAEEYGGVSERLIECSENINCPKHADALFWVAGSVLSKTHVEGESFSFDSDGSPESIMEGVISHVVNSPPEQTLYDYLDPEFQRGLALMHKANDAGSIYAPNELGLLYMEQPEILNLGLAKKYLKQSLQLGEPMSAYNLARLARMENPNEYSTIIKYLRIAAAGKDPALTESYMLGLQVFGSSEEKRTAVNYFQKNRVEKSMVRDEFSMNFNVSF